MTSYQRRLKDIEYYKQRGKDLEDYIRQLVEDRKKHEIKPFVPMMLKGISGNDTMNDVNSGDFTLRLSFNVGGV